MSELDDDADDRVRDALEARLIQEEIEAAAEQLYRNTRTLGELLLDWCDGGSQVQIEVGQLAWSGTVAGVADSDGKGLLALRTDGARVEIDLAGITAASRITELPLAQPMLDTWLPGSIVARLRWCATQDPAPMVTIGGIGAEAVTGVVAAVSERHVELARSGLIVAVPIPMYVVILD